MIYVDSFLLISSVTRKHVFANAETKNSSVVTMQLISVFFPTSWIVESLFFLNLKFQASSHLLWLYSPVCVGPGQKPRRQGFL